MRILLHLWLLLSVAPICHAQLAVSQYPNTNNIAPTNLFLLSIKGAPGTNMNISFQQLLDVLYWNGVAPTNSPTLRTPTLFRPSLMYLLDPAMTALSVDNDSLDIFGIGNVPMLTFDAFNYIATHEAASNRITGPALIENNLDVSSNLNAFRVTAYGTGTNYASNTWEMVQGQFRGDGAGLTNVAGLSTNAAFSPPQWIDLLGQAVLPTLAVSAPALTATTNGSAVLGMGFQQNDYVMYQFQFPHNLAVTNAGFPNFYFIPHLHFSVNGTIDATHSNVTWIIQYEYGMRGAQYSTAASNTVTVGVESLSRHYDANFAAITNNALGTNALSAIFRCKIMRGVSGSQDLSPNSATRDVILDSVDVHVPVGNMTLIGSRSTTSQ